MKQHLANITLLVREYDEALDFYTNILGFEIVEDTVMTETKRWVRIRPQGSAGVCLLLAKPKNEEEASRIGNQTGGRVFLFLHTDHFDRDFNNYTQKGVEVFRAPSEETYGKVAVIKDLYGNLIDLIEPR